jgi:hypothetical protein
MLSRLALLGLAGLLGAACSLYVEKDDTDANVDVFPPDAGSPPDAGPAPDAAVCAACTESIACPAPGQGRASVCGLLLDVETDTRLRLGDCVVCVPGEAAEGPCALRLAAYDARQLHGNPTGATPLSASATYVDTCGRFYVQGIPVAPNQLVAVTADTDGDAYRRSATFFSLSPGARVQNAPLSITRASTDAAWTQSAGNPFGDTSVAAHGVLALRFRHGGPAAGVTATINGDTATALYFGDTNPTVRSTIAPAQTETGVNGGALVTEGDVAVYSGTGGLPEDCAWRQRMGAVIPGVVVTADVRAEGAGCP